MIHIGENVIDGIPFTVTRRRARRIGIRVKADGSIHLTVPMWRATLAESEAFLTANWGWALRSRERMMSRAQQPAPAEREASEEEIASLQELVGDLHDRWSAALGEGTVPWKLRRMKTRWGVCDYVKRRITYAVMLAGKPRELVEYVVVHELTHLAAHGHGPRFQGLMDRRLPGWRERRRTLNRWRDRSG